MILIDSITTNAIKYARDDFEDYLPFPVEMTAQRQTDLCTGILACLIRFRSVFYIKLEKVVS